MDPVKGGGSGPGFKWEQTLTDVTIFIEVRPNVRLWREHPACTTVHGGQCIVCLHIQRVALVSERAADYSFQARSTTGIVQLLLLLLLLLLHLFTHCLLDTQGSAEQSRAK